MNISNKINNRIRREKKRLYQKLTKFQEERRIVFIVGKQRSGTTMLNEIFDRDLRSKTYGEDGGLAQGEGRGTRLRWLPWKEIKDIFDKEEKAPLIVAKPLVESQLISKILDYFPDSKAIWMYRHYQGVVNSGIKKFGSKSTYYNLNAIIESQHDHWYAENVSNQTQTIVAKYFTEDRPLQDLKALGWYIRNVLFFEQHLQRDSRVTLCKYEEIVSNPQASLKGIYRFIDLDYPGDHIVKFVHNRSVEKGRQIQLSSDIKMLCDDLFLRMDNVYLSQK